MNKIMEWDINIKGPAKKSWETVHNKVSFMLVKSNYSCFTWQSIFYYNDWWTSILQTLEFKGF